MYVYAVSVSALQSKILEAVIKNCNMKEHIVIVPAYIGGNSL